jgi:hypothetical protein
MHPLPPRYTPRCVAPAANHKEHPSP